EGDRGGGQRDGAGVAGGGAVERVGAVEASAGDGGGAAECDRGARERDVALVEDGIGDVQRPWPGVEGELPRPAVNHAGDRAAGGEGEGVVGGATGQVRGAGEGDEAVERACVGAGHVPGVGRVGGDQRAAGAATAVVAQAAGGDGVAVAGVDDERIL